MQRRTAVAAASAISMALVSGVIAVAANLGALGFVGTSSSPTPATVPASVTQAAPQPDPQAQVSIRSSHESGEHEHEGGEHEGAGATAASSASTGGEHDD
jgi:hypothetical protein